ncbi:hypothetical protein RF11_13260 [Thelohanellus kitauei]|uniref:Uncharacterized protein n=1 Tax=Thelohanellus kitauei TaxID=669202 RepID=A0A0C2JT25_THEKT|nr:hypothetical protein RF11_13260 [Thelohanellus kitauei]
MISSLIWAEIKPSNKSFFDDLRCFPSTKRARFSKRGRTLRIHPSCYKNHAEMEPSSINVYTEDAFKWVFDQCNLMNIPVNVDDSKRFLYPRFSSLSDLDLLTFTLFSNKDIYPKTARFNPGVDILSL